MASPPSSDSWSDDGDSPHAHRVAPAAISEAQLGCHANRSEPFPMYVMRMKDFLSLDHLQPHNVLLKRGLLVQLDDSDCSSSVNFISHQWCGHEEADPDGAHLRTMQATFSMAASGGAIFRSDSDRAAFFQGYSKTNSQFIMDCRRASRVDESRRCSLISCGSDTGRMHGSLHSSPTGTPRGSLCASPSSATRQTPSHGSSLPKPPARRSDLSPILAKQHSTCGSDTSNALSRSSSGGTPRRQPMEVKSAFVASVADGYVWIDFISIPQTLTCTGEDDFREVAEAQRRAIACIPAYVARANNFWVCAPSGVAHQSGGLCDYGSWASRGWCRMEETCLALVNRGDGRPLLVTQPLGDRPSVQVLDSMDRLSVHAQRHTAVLTGDFTCCQRGHVHITADGRQVCTPCDKAALRPLLANMYESQLSELRAGFADAPSGTPFWDVLRPAMAVNGPFFQHLLLRMNMLNVLADSLTEQVAHGPGYSKPLEDLTDDDLEAYLHSWGTSDIAVQRDELPILAIREGHLTLLRYIVERHGAPLLLSPNLVGLTPLQEAARTGRTELVRYLIDSYGREATLVNHRSGSSGCSALSDAAMRGHAEVVRLLLSHGADVHARRTDGRTALHGAAEHGYTDVIQVLLDAGACPFDVDLAAATPLQLSQVWHRKARALLAEAEAREAARQVCRLPLQ